MKKSIIFAFCTAIMTCVMAKTATVFMVVSDDMHKSVYDYAHSVSDPESEKYGQFMSADDLAKFVNVPESKYVTEYLDNFKSTVTYKNYGDSIEVFGSTDDVTNVLKNITSPVSQYVYFIEGVNSVERNENIKHTTRTKKTNTSTADAGYVGRETISQLYNIPMNLTVNTPSSVALIEFSDGGFGRSDYFKSLQLNGVNSTTKPVVIGEDDMAGTESSLDVQMVGITAPNVTMWYIDYDSTQWVASFAVNVSNMQSPPLVCSVSYGWSVFHQCEIVSCGNLSDSEYVDLSNYHLAKMAMRGVTVCVSSGDSGAPSRANEMCSDTPTVQAEFPSASPWVLSVGGVFIVNTNHSENSTFTTPFCHQYTCATGNKTMLVENQYVGWGSGSGFTPNNNRSDVSKWQNTLVDKYLTTNVSFPSDFNKYGVSRPDVLGVAHNAGVVMFGVVSSVDGTSMSSPIVAGMIGLLNDKRLRNGQPQLGFANHLLYKLKMTHVNTFTNGYVGNTADTESTECTSNYGYFTDGTTEFSNPTGLGSPVFSNIYPLV